MQKKRMSNEEWQSKTDADARITRLEDGRTRLGYKPEIVADIETGAILAAPVHLADAGDTQTIEGTLEAARENVLTAVEASNAATEDKDQLPDDVRRRRRIASWWVSSSSPQLPGSRARSPAPCGRRVQTRLSKRGQEPPPRIAREFHVEPPVARPRSTPAQQGE